MAHFSLEHPMGKVDTEASDDTLGAGSKTTEQSDTIPLQSGGGNTGSGGDGSDGSDGANGKQTDTNDDATGFGDAKTDAVSQGGADGTGDTASQSGDKKSTKSKGK